MKFLVAAVIAVSAQVSFAACLGEAQIIAKVQAHLKTNLSCVAYVDAASISQYNESGVCPLDLDEVLATGVEVGINQSNHCRLQAGDIITGTLVKTASGSIVLE